MTMDVTLSVNGADHSSSLDPRATLLHEAIVVASYIPFAAAAARRPAQHAMGDRPLTCIEEAKRSPASDHVSHLPQGGAKRVKCREYRTHLRGHPPAAR